MRREEIVALLIVLLLILPITNWYLPCFPSSLFKKLRKSFFLFMCVPIRVRARIHTIFLASVSFAKRHLCGNSPNVAILILVDIKASVSSGTVHRRPVNASSALYVSFMWQPRSTVSLLSMFGLIIAFSWFLNLLSVLDEFRKTYQQKGASLSWSNTSI